MADDHLDQLDYYTLLGVDPKASVEEIRAAFRKFALKFHPDRHLEGGPERVARATAIYRRGSEALETLVDPVRRKAYDIVLARGELRLTSDARTVATQGPKSSRTGARRSAVGASRPGQGRRSVAPSTRRSVAPAAPSGGQPSPRTTHREIQSPTAKAFYARGLEASRAGDYRTAMRMIESALQQEPGHPLLLEAKRRLAPYV
jgi:curved DNA-binding protein CbpA